jgi:UDP-N-acetylmuramoylalanine--D-glutamate ligase
MTPVTTFAGQTVAVFGLGRSGLAAARALVAGGARVVCADDAAEGRDAATRAVLTVEDLQGADWARFAALVLAPGVPLTHPEPHWTVARARAAGVEIIGDVELYCRERAKTCPGASFLAVTGTNGKSTTTALIAHVLRAAGRDVQVGGNIGTAILELAPPAEDRIHVIEMSSFQIDLTPSLAPTAGVLLNISPDHLDRHGTLEHYAAVKERLVMAAGVSLGGADDDVSRAHAKRPRNTGAAELTV